jgi:orotate phosphoribosyltransferase
MSEQEILDHLAEEGAVLTGSHFIYTSGLHGTAYINMRAVAHEAGWLDSIGSELAGRIRDFFGASDVDLIIGPETLGRTLAGDTAKQDRLWSAIWCDIVEADGVKQAVFSEKLNFGRLVQGKSVVIVDDLLTTGSSIKLVANLINESGGDLLGAVVVVRRTPEVSESDCGVPFLSVLADIPGFLTFTEEECSTVGPCSTRTPVVLRPGHGWKWIEDHPGYPTA